MSWADYTDVIVSNLHLAALVTGAAIGSAATHWFWSTIPEKTPPIVDPKNQTRELPDGSRVAACLEGNELMTRLSADIRTLYDVVTRGMRLSNNGPMLGWRQKKGDGSEPYVWLSYQQVLDGAMQLAFGLRRIGVKCGQETHIGILMKNRPEWKICELAAYCNNNVVVPIYPTMGVQACEHIINETQMNVIFVDSESKAIDLVKGKHPWLQHIVTVDTSPNEASTNFAALSLSLWSLRSLQQLGEIRKNRQQLQLPTPDDICTICYTSGTTGNPKGVVLTHGNIVACCTALLFLRKAPFLSTDTMFSFLPLAHLMQRMLEVLAFAVGMRVGYYRGITGTIFDDMKELQPTILICVPRILNKIYERAIAEANTSLLSKYIFKAALAYKKLEVLNGINRNDTVVDKLVLKKLQNSLGGRVKLIMTGSAPIAEEILQFSRAALGCVVLQGYGQTECSCLMSLCIEEDIIGSTIGIPACCNAVKLVDVPELGHFAMEKRGEICIKGANVFKGYFKDREKTAQVLDADGWLHTGDLGEWTQRGTMRIIGRIRSTFKLSQGEYIAPERIESVYLRSRFVSQIFVYGESMKSCIIAIVVPNIETLNEWSHKRFGVTMSSHELCASKEMKNLIMSDMNRVADDALLCSFEKVKDIYLSAEPFSLANDEITATLKLRRIKLQEHYSKQLLQMYSNLK